MAERDLALATDALADTVLLSSTVAIVAVDLEGRVVLWNRGATRIFGWTEDEARGRFLPFMPPECEAEYTRIFDRLRRGEEFDELELPHMTREGRRAALLVSLRGLTASDGERRAIVGVAQESRDPEAADELLRRIESLELRLSETHLPPHFLLNSLHAIGVLVRERRSEDAVRALANVGDILRRALGRAGRGDDEVPLGREIELVRKYLEVERARFGGQLRLEVEAGEDVRDALVPNLVLQPLVENAIRHGLAPLDGRGTVRIAARRDHETLELTVTDDGVGLTPGWSAGEAEGVGLRATRSRLRRLYGEEADLRLGPADPDGARATVRLPHRSRREAPVRVS